jgi:hypothetical protein
MRKSELRQIIREEIKKLNESQTFNYKGDTYKVDFIKNKTFDGTAWHLLLTDKKDGTIYAWPNVFSYSEGWTQGMGRSVMQYFLQTKGYGGVSQGSGVNRPATPSYINDQLEYIIDHWKGKGYSEDSAKWYKDNVNEFPKGTKKGDIANQLF